MKQQPWPHERASTDLPLDQLLAQAVLRFPLPSPRFRGTSGRTQLSVLLTVCAMKSHPPAGKLTQLTIACVFSAYCIVLRALKSCASEQWVI
jgi:hypothetical protein